MPDRRLTTSDIALRTVFRETNRVLRAELFAEDKTLPTEEAERERRDAIVTGVILAGLDALLVLGRPEEDVHSFAATVANEAVFIYRRRMARMQH